MNNLKFDDSELAILYSWGEHVNNTDTMEEDEAALFARIYEAIKPAVDLAKSWEKT